MIKKQVKCQAYIRPEITVINLEQEWSLLAGSPPVQPGGGGGGGVGVVPPGEDNDGENDDITGAKGWGWDLWEE